jgi:rubredoxin
MVADGQGVANIEGGIVGAAYRCDRCKGYEPDKPPVKVTMLPQGTEQPLRSDYELCPRCLTGLHDFLDAYQGEADRV